MFVSRLLHFFLVNDSQPHLHRVARHASLENIYWHSLHLDTHYWAAVVGDCVMKSISHQNACHSADLSCLQRKNPTSVPA